MVPFGKAKVVQPGTDLTVITYGAVVPRALQAAQKLEREHSVSVELLDLRTLNPFDWDAIAASVKKTNRALIAYPAERYSVSYAINFPHPLIGSERFQVELSNGSYVKQIASARTFGFLEQQHAMLNMGLIRGASRDNCIVLTPEGIDNPPLRYSDEFVRHKVLDLIGDLALFGKHILGYVKADRAGHAMHTATVSRI